MFGVTSALEKYQKITSDVLAGCSGVANIAYDLVIHGTDLEEHDSNLRKVLTRLDEQGLTVNGDKCQFRLPRLTFFGHELSARGVAPSEEKIAAVLNARPPQNVSEVRSCTTCTILGEGYSRLCASRRAFATPVEKGRSVCMGTGTRRCLPQA